MRNASVLVLISLAFFISFFFSLFSLHEPPLPRPRLVRKLSAYPAHFLQRRSGRSWDQSAQEAESLFDVSRTTLRSIFAGDSGDGLDDWAETVPSRQHRQPDAASRLRVPPQGILHLNSSARPLLSLSADRKYLVLTVIRDRVPTGIQYRPWRAIVERYVRLAGLLFRVNPAKVQSSSAVGEAASSPAAAPEGDEYEWLYRDDGWEMQWRDELDGPVDAMSSTDEDGLLAVAYRVMRDEEHEVHLRIYDGFPGNTTHAPPSNESDSGPETKAPPMQDMKLRGNTRVTALSISASQVMYAREGDIRVFRVLKQNGTAAPTGLIDRTNTTAARPVHLATWEPVAPGPYADRTPVFGETIAIHPLYSNTVESALGIHIRGKSSEVNVVLNTYRYIVPSPAPPDSTSAGNASDATPSVPPDAAANNDSTKPVAEWQQMPSYWERPLYTPAEDDLAFISDPLFASSRNYKSVLFCLGHVMIGLDYLPPPRPTLPPSSTAASASTSAPRQGSYQVHELLMDFAETVRHVSFSHDHDAVALLFQEGGVVVLRRGPLSTAARRTRLSDTLTDLITRLDSTNGTGGLFGLEQEGARALQPWETHLSIAAYDRSSTVLGLLYVASSEIEAVVPSDVRSSRGYVLVVYKGGGLASFDVGETVVVSGLRSFLQTRWKLVMGLVTVLAYFLWNEYAIRRFREQQRASTAAAAPPGGTEAAPAVEPVLRPPAPVPMPGLRPVPPPASLPRPSSSAPSSSSASLLPPPALSDGLRQRHSATTGGVGD